MYRSPYGYGIITRINGTLSVVSKDTWNRIPTINGITIPGMYMYVSDYMHGDMSGDVIIDGTSVHVDKSLVIDGTINSPLSNETIVSINQNRIRIQNQYPNGTRFYVSCSNGLYVGVYIDENIHILSSNYGSVIQVYKPHRTIDIQYNGGYLVARG